MTIKHWPAAEQPREKLLSYGAGALSDGELLAIFLGHGCAGLDAVAMSRQLLQDFGGVRAFFAAPRGQFCRHKGLGVHRYVKTQAVLELCKRCLYQHLQRDTVFSDPGMVKHYLQYSIGLETREVFMTRIVVQSALAHNAAAVILAHNHPSGVAEPSRADRAITERLTQAMALVDIKLLDHFVVGDAEVISFAERGWL